jgi:hypothetical protein
LDVTNIFARSCTEHHWRCSKVIITTLILVFLGLVLIELTKKRLLSKWFCNLFVAGLSWIKGELGGTHHPYSVMTEGLD